MAIPRQTKKKDKLTTNSYTPLYHSKGIAIMTKNALKPIKE